MKNNFKSDANFYVVNSLKGEPVRTLFNLSDSLIPGKVTSRAFFIIGYYGDVLCIKAYISTDSHEFEGIYTINSKTGKKTLIKCDIRLGR